MLNPIPSIKLSKKIEINRCIYCGGKGETDEHMIPLALSGSIILKCASCESCRVITSKHEYNPLHHVFAEARASLNYPSRKRNFSKEEFPLQVVLKNGQKTTLKLTQQEITGFATFLEYSLPGFFYPGGYTKKGINVTGLRAVVFKEEALLVMKKYEVKSFTQNTTYEGNHFETMVARIAYTFVIACWGLDSLKNNFVLPAILSQKDDIGFWVGCDPEGKIISPIGNVQGGNVMKIGIWTRKNDVQRYVVVRIKFFANSPTPEYIVVVGTLRNDFIVPKIA